MATTPNLGITHLEQQQLQPHVQVNAGFDGLDTAIAGRAVISAAGTGNLTLTAAQQRNSAIEFTGELTGNRSIIVSTAKKWHVKNATTGAFTLTVKRASGSGVEIPAGAWREVFNDGTNVELIGIGAVSAPTFAQLADTPSSYSGHAGKAVAVKVTEDGLQFVEFPEGGGGGGGASSFLDLDDAPAVADYDGLAGQYIRINAGETGFEFVTPPSPEAISMSEVVGDGTQDEFAINHDFGSRNLFVMVRETASPYARLADSLYEVEFTDPNNILVRFDSAPASGEYEVFIAIPWIGGETVTPGSGSAEYEVAGEYEFSVPSGVEAITGKAWGAGGGGTQAGGIGKSGGGGGFAQCTCGVTPGETLTIKVGAGGAALVYAAGLSVTATGGGLTGIFRGSTPLLIAGSGGGAGICPSALDSDSGNGGAGGGSSGVTGGGGGFGGGGGSQVVGGAAGAGGGGAGNGGYLTAGNGGIAVDQTYDGYGGGGGYGYYGGGGGGADSDTTSGDSDGGGGGGGSGYVTGVDTTLTAGSGATPANTADADYGLLFAGKGGSGNNSGNPGRIVLSWGV